MRTEALSPREVRDARLLPYECKTRWGYPPETQLKDLPMHVRNEVEAAMVHVEVSRENGTLRQDYPQLFEVSPWDDIVLSGGLVIHEYQL